MKTSFLLILLMAASCGGAGIGGSSGKSGSASSSASGGKSDSADIGKNGSERKDSSQKNSARECQKDSDCVLVQKTCCPCSSGGVMMAIPQRLKKSYLKKLQSKCHELTVCPDWFRCGEWKGAKCADSKCLAAAAGAQK